MKSKYYIEQFDPGSHKSGLITFWNHYLTTDFDSRYDWFYTDNSFGVAKSWILREENLSEILGCASYFPRKLIIGDYQYSFGVNCDFSINKKHRVLGPAIKLLKEVTNGYPDYGLDFLLAFPNNKAKNIFKRCGYVELGFFYRWAKPLIYRKFVEIRYPRNLPSHYLASSFDSLLNVYRHIDSACLNPNVRIEKTSYISETLDNLYIGNDRISFPSNSSQYIYWRYIANQSICANIANIVIDNKVNGILIYELNEGIFEIYYLFFMNYKKNYNKIMSKLFLFALKESAYTVSFGFYGGNNFNKLCKNNHFFKKEKRLVCIHAKNDKILDKIVNSNILLFDGDVDL